MTSTTKPAVKCQLDIIFRGMAASGRYTGKDAAQMATEAICRAWGDVATDGQTEEEEEEGEEEEELAPPHKSPKVTLPTIEFLTPRKGNKTPTAARYSSGKKRAQHTETAQEGTPLKKRRG